MLSAGVVLVRNRPADWASEVDGYPLRPVKGKSIGALGAEPLGGQPLGDLVDQTGKAPRGMSLGINVWVPMRSMRRKGTGAWGIPPGNNTRGDEKNGQAPWDQKILGTNAWVPQVSERGH